MAQVYQIRTVYYAKGGAPESGDNTASMVLSLFTIYVRQCFKQNIDKNLDRKLLNEVSVVVQEISHRARPIRHTVRSQLGMKR
jgi:hypothetical protein